MPNPLNYYYLSENYADIGAASTVRFVVPQDGYLRRVGISLAGAITTTAAVITVSVDNTALSPTITIPVSGSAEGTYTEQEYWAPVKRGSWIEVASDGGPANSVVAGLTLSLST